MLTLLEEELLRRLRGITGLGVVSHTSSVIAATSGAVAVDDLRKAAGVSSTHLARRFKELIGVTPKRLARSYRFATTVLSINPGDVPLDDSGYLKVSQASYDHTRSYWDQIGATIAGRRVFDMTDGWDGKPPAGVDHVVVVTHRPEPECWDPEAAFHFVDGVEAAVAKAQELAGDRIVEVAAGDVGGQALAAAWSTRGAGTSYPSCSGPVSAFSGRSTPLTDLNGYDSASMHDQTSSPRASRKILGPKTLVTILGRA